MTTGDAVGRPAFDALVREVYVPLRRYLVRRAPEDVADDVLGDTLLVLWRRVDDIPADRPLPWCYGVAQRCLANARRADDRRGALLRRLTTYAEPDPYLGWAPADDPAAEALAAALARLPARDREVLRLWAWEGLQPREIAVALDITGNAASIRLHRATARLRRALGGKDPAPAGHEHLEQLASSTDTETPR